MEGNNMDIQMLEKKLTGISKMIETVLRRSGYLDMGDLLLVEYDTDNPNDILLYETYMGIFSHLKEAYSLLSYLQKPVICEGMVEYSGNEYVLDGIRLADEELFEVLERDEYTGKWKWTLTSICEYFETDYDGMRARVRGNGGIDGRHDI